jgi:hypothetical protein
VWTTVIFEHPISPGASVMPMALFVCTPIGMVDVDPNVFETANAGFAQAMYEEFLKDPTAVGPDWRRLFESGIVGERPETTRNGGNAAGGTGAGGTAPGETAAACRPAPLRSRVPRPSSSPT